MFTVYSKDNCGFCVKAYALLDLKGAAYRKEILDTEEKLQAFKARGFRQVPQIYFNDELIGGFDKLEVWYKTRDAAEDSAFDD
jgi:glutaredoxin